MPAKGALRRGLRAILALLLLATVCMAALLVANRLLSAGSQSAAVGWVTNTNLGDRLLGLYLALRSAELQTPANSSDRQVDFTVYPGETTIDIARRLQQVGLIRDAELFRLYARYQGADGRLEAGEYRLRSNMTIPELTAALMHGLPGMRRVTLREGLRAEEIAEIMAAAGIADATQFMDVVRNARFDYPALQDRPVSSTLEGYLFPDTYQIANSATVTQVVELLVKTFDSRFTPAMRQQAAAQKRTIFQVVTIASLVEREARLPAERPLIASVYLNRLAKGMPLEADSTVQYAMGYDAKNKTWWPALRLEDLRKPVGPYSTYLNVGLPPGPICNPGLASLQAVLEPANTGYLYYFAKGDGSHAFATTFEEHQENMRKYAR